MTLFKRKILRSKPRKLSWSALNRANKRYYQKVENYDWTDIADHFKGPETLLHRWREFWMVYLIRRFRSPARLKVAAGNRRPREVPSLPRDEMRPALDIGCGTGLILRHLPPGSYGVDINPRNLKRLKKYAPGRKGILADVERKLPFKNESFSLVTAAEVLEHLVYPEKALREIKRVMKKGGVFIGSVPIDNWFWKLRFLSVSYHKLGQQKEPFHNEMTQKELHALLRTAFKCFYIYPHFISNFFFVAWKD